MQKWAFFLCLLFLSAAHADDPQAPPPKPLPSPQLQPLPEPTPPPVEHPVEQTNTALVSKYWKFHHAVYMGYRRDRQQFKSYGSGLLNMQTNVKDRNSVQVMAASHAEFGDIVGYLRASYAWLVSGHTDFRVPGAAPPLSFLNFDMGAGYEADVRGAVNYRIKLYDRPAFGFSFMPGIGYRYASMMNFSEGEEQYNIPGSSDFAIGRLPNPNHQDWFGFFVDGRVEVRFFDLCRWLLSCQYHQPYLVSKSTDQISMVSSGPFSKISSVLKAPSAHMLLGMSDIKFYYGSGWTFGLNFEGASTWSRKGTDRAVLKQQTFGSPTVVTKSTSRATVQWTFYSASFMVERTF